MAEPDDDDDSRKRWVRFDFIYPPTYAPKASFHFSGIPALAYLNPPPPPLPEFATFNAVYLGPNDVRKPFGPVGHCIYCGETEFEPGTGRKLSEEHFVPEGLGSRLALLEASCKTCAGRIQKSEANILAKEPLNSMLIEWRR